MWKPHASAPTMSVAGRAPSATSAPRTSGPQTRWRRLYARTARGWSCPRSRPRPMPASRARSGAAQKTGICHQPPTARAAATAEPRRAAARTAKAARRSGCGMATTACISSSSDGLLTLFASLANGVSQVKPNSARLVSPATGRGALHEALAARTEAHRRVQAVGVPGVEHPLDVPEAGALDRLLGEHAPQPAAAVLGEHVDVGEIGDGLPVGNHAGEAGLTA